MAKDTRSRKKVARRSVSEGIAHIHASFNNTAAFKEIDLWPVILVQN